jgi:hypothetical protein
VHVACTAVPELPGTHLLPNTLCLSRMLGVHPHYQQSVPGLTEAEMDYPRAQFRRLPVLPFRTPQDYHELYVELPEELRRGGLLSATVSLLTTVSAATCAALPLHVDLPMLLSAS